MTRLTPLQPGDTVAIVAPAGLFPEDRYARGVEHLERRGYRVREGAALRRTHRYLSAPDLERAADLEAAFTDPEIRAVFCRFSGPFTPRFSRAFTPGVPRA